MKRLCFLLLFFAVISSGCKKDEPVSPPAGTGGEAFTDVAFDFRLFVNGVPVHDSSFFTNSSGDKFSIHRFNYYISNIRLTRTDGFVYHEKDVYRLMKHMDTLTSFIVKKVPAGKYQKMEFLIGVDSLRNVSGIQSGALDPVHNMFWDWNSGYIFFKMEGDYSTNTQPAIEQYGIHIGGFTGPNSCLQTATITFDTLLYVKARRIATVYVAANAEEVFYNPHNMGFDHYFSNISDRTFREVSENYRDMFSVRHIEN
jgi:hypothetical protein